MNHEFTRLMSFKASVRAMKRLERPLSIWPGDVELVKLVDLPVVKISPGSLIDKPDHTFVVITDRQLRDRLITGKRYAKLTSGPTVRGEWTVGEWL